MAASLVRDICREVSAFAWIAYAPNIPQGAHTVPMRSTPDVDI